MHRIPAYYCVAAVLALNCLTADPVKADDFFAPAPDLAASLDPNGIYPQGQIIGFGLYSVSGQNNDDPSKTNMQRVAEEGFTLVGPYYHQDDFERSERLISEAASNGLKFTFALRGHPDLRGVPLEDRPGVIDSLSDEQIASNIREQLVDIYRDPQRNNTVARWSLLPEELRSFRDSEVRYLRIASETIRETETQFGNTPRPFWMYEANNRDRSSLQVTGEYQDIIGKGVYLNSLPRGDQRSGRAMRSLNQIVDVADRQGKTAQAFYELYRDYPDESTNSVPAEIRKVIRHDVYLGLVKGIKSINIFSGFENRPDLTTRNEQFEAYGAIARELTGPLGLQKIFLFGEHHNDLTLTQDTGQCAIHYTDTFFNDDKDEYTFDSISFSNLADEDGNRYLFLVNSSEEDASVTVDGLPFDLKNDVYIEDLFAGEKTLLTGSSLRVQLEGLGVKAFEISVPEPGSGLIVGIGLIMACTRFSRIDRNWGFATKL